MKTADLGLGVYSIEPQVFSDDRGYFFEAWREDTFAALGIEKKFVQDNQSFSRKGVLRGMHYQRRNPQAKLVRVLSGEIYDVAVDFRPGSRTFGKWVGIRLTAVPPCMVYIPEGFAHGFLVLSETAEVLYKTSDFYAPSEERGVRWDCPKIKICWPIWETPVLSPRDAAFPTLGEITPENLPGDL